MTDQQKLEAVLRCQGIQRCLWQSLLDILSDKTRAEIAEGVDDKGVVGPEAVDRFQKARLDHQRKLRDAAAKEATREPLAAAATEITPAIDDPLAL
jgi:hypothetical protein